MKRVVGIDIGNSTTESALAEIHESGEVRFLGSAIANTTGIKGTKKPHTKNMRKVSRPSSSTAKSSTAAAASAA